LRGFSQGAHIAEKVEEKAGSPPKTEKRKKTQKIQIKTSKQSLPKLLLQLRDFSTKQ